MGEVAGWREQCQPGPMCGAEGLLAHVMGNVSGGPRKGRRVFENTLG